MSDEEKRIISLLGLANAVNTENQQMEYDNAAKQMKMLFDSFVHAGFTDGQAMQIMMSMIRIALGMK